MEVYSLCRMIVVIGLEILLDRSLGLVSDWRIELGFILGTELSF